MSASTNHAGITDSYNEGLDHSQMHILKETISGNRPLVQLKLGIICCWLYLSISKPYFL